MNIRMAYVILALSQMPYVFSMESESEVNFEVEVIKYGTHGTLDNTSIRGHVVIADKTANYQFNPLVQIPSKEIDFKALNLLENFPPCPYLAQVLKAFKPVDTTYLIQMNSLKEITTAKIWNSYGDCDAPEHDLTDQTTLKNVLEVVELYKQLPVNEEVEDDEIPDFNETEDSKLLEND